MRLAAYLRDSGGDRQENSTDRQLAEIQEWATKNGAVIEAVYRDEARPGSSTVGREHFLEMIHDFRSPGCTYSGLIIWSWSRFARDIDDAQFYRADLRRRGYEIHSVSDPIPDGPMGRFIEAAIDWKNAQFLADLSKDVKSGLRDLVMQNGAVPGTPPRGFRREPVEIGSHRDGGRHVVHRWVPDENLVPLVREAFEMRARGASIRDIQEKTGLYKNKNSWTTFFTNKLYVGILEYGGFVIEDYCEPVISLELWDAVQSIIRLSDNGRITDGGSMHPRRVSSDYLLSGMARCARCGSMLSGHNRSGYRTYACGRAKRRFDCDLKTIPANILEKAVLDEITAVLETPALLIAERDRAHQRLAGDREKLNGQLNAQRQRLAEIRRQIGRITDAIANAGHSRALLEKLSNLERDEAAALLEISRLERLMGSSILEQPDDELKNLAASNRAALAVANRDQLRLLIRGLVAEIVVDRQDREIIGQVRIWYPPPDLKKK